MTREDKMPHSSRTPQRFHRARYLALGTGLLAGGVLAVQAILPRPPATSPAVPAPAPLPECGIDAAPLPGDEGDAPVRYRLSYRAELCSAAECTALIDLGGALVARERVVRQGVDRVVDLALELETVTGDVQTHLPSRAALGTPMAVSYAPNGRVTGLRTQQQVDAPTLRLLESITRDLQVANPECHEPGTARWSGVEDLVAASVMSTFSWDAAANELSWTRDRVLAWNDANDLFPLRARSSTLATSRHSARLRGTGHLDAVNGLDEFVLQVGAPGEELRLRVTSRLERTLDQVAAAAPAEFEGFDKPSTRTELADEQRIGGRNLTGLLGELVHAKPAGSGAERSRSRLFVATSALLRRDPAAARQAQDLVRSGHKEKQFLINALGEAGTAQSATLLAELLGTADATLRTMTLGALGRATVAEPAVVDAMSGLFADRSVGGTARLMTGALASHARDSSPETSEKAVSALLTDYRGSTAPVRRADGLRALGNAGDMSALSDAREAAASADPVMRAAAAQALRRIPSDAADRILATLAEDSVDFVRRSALSAALYRDPTEILEPVVERVSRLDAVATVRREAVRALVRWKDEVPSARTTLDWIARNDAEADLRSVANEGLRRFAN